jgi:hypothetical protein
MSAKGFILITDSDAIKEFERAFAKSGEGFTIVPEVWGRGQTGLRTGDRVHPGGSSLLFTVVSEDQADATLRLLREVRDRAGVAEFTKIFVTTMDEVS